MLRRRGAGGGCLGALFLPQGVLKKFLTFGKKSLHFAVDCDNIIKLSVSSWRYAAVAQLDRVTGYEPVGRGFESLQPYQKSPETERFQGFFVAVFNRFVSR